MNSLNGQLTKFYNAENALEVIERINRALLTICVMEKDERLTHAERRHYSYVITALSKQIAKVIADEYINNKNSDIGDIPF